MKKANNILITLCALVCILIVVILYAVLKITNQPTSISTTDTVVNSEVPDKNNVKLEVSCAQQAQVILKSEREKQTGNITITNHYNKILSKCIVNVLTTDTDSTGIFIQSDIRDAYEQKVLLACVSGSKFSSYCFIPTNSSDNGKFVKLTAEEGQNMIRSYMNN